MASVKITKSGIRDARTGDQGRFKILEVLGSGGFGQLFGALDRESGEQVLIKTLPRSPGMREDLEPDASTLIREFEALMRIDHFNVIRAHELFDGDEDISFTMPYSNGVTFLEYVRPGLGETLRLERLAPTLLQVVDGLLAVHDAGLIHCNVKPSSVLITETGRALLLDFEIATPIASSTGVRRDMIVGTPLYMAPEQLRGAPVPASDFYCLGTMIFEALTGRLPFGDGDSKLEDIIIKKLSHDAPDPSTIVPNLPEDLSTLCRELLQREPERRPSGAEIRHRLQKIVRETQFDDEPVVRRVGRPLFFAGIEDPLTPTIDPWDSESLDAEPLAPESGNVANYRWAPQIVVHAAPVVAPEIADPFLLSLAPRLHLDVCLPDCDQPTTDTTFRLFVRLGSMSPEDLSFGADHVDILLLGCCADIEPLRRRLRLPPTGQIPEKILDWAITPRSAGTLDLEVVVLCRNEPIHRAKLPLIVEPAMPPPPPTERTPRSDTP